MNTFKEYIAEASTLSEAGVQKAKWIIDKKARGHIILKAGTKMLFRMCKFQNMSEPYYVNLISTTKRKTPGNLFATLKDAMNHIDKMFTYAFLDEYDVEPMSKEVVDWLEKGTY